MYDAFVEKLKVAVGKLKVGNGTEPGVTQGPLIDKAAVAKMKEHIADAVAKGGKVVMGGHPHSLGHTFFEPTIITGATQDMLVAHEETFGPLAPVIKFDTDEDAIRMANDTEFGLGRLFLCAEPETRVARGRSHRGRHRRHQHGADLNRRRALRWRKAIRPRPRRLEVRHR